MVSEIFGKAAGKTMGNLFMSFQVGFKINSRSFLIVWIMEEMRVKL